MHSKATRLHPECEHCQHHLEPAKATHKITPPGSLDSKAQVLKVFELYIEKSLSRAQIQKATGLSGQAAMIVLMELMGEKRVVYSGLAPDARGAKYKLRGVEVVAKWR